MRRTKGPRDGGSGTSHRVRLTRSPLVALACTQPVMAPPNTVDCKSSRHTPQKEVRPVISSGWHCGWRPAAGSKALTLKGETGKMPHSCLWAVPAQ